MRSPDQNSIADVGLVINVEASRSGGAIGNADMIAAIGRAVVGGHLDVFNLVRFGAWTYAYDLENRLMEAACTTNTQACGGFAGTMEILYDAHGRRAEKRWTPLSGSVKRTYFLHQGDQLIAEFEGLGGAPSTAPARHYLRGPGVDEAVADTVSARYLHQDWPGAFSLALSALRPA